MKLILLAFALALLAFTATPQRSPYVADVPVRVINLATELPDPGCHKKYTVVYERSERTPVIKVFVIDDDYVKDDPCQ